MKNFKGTPGPWSVNKIGPHWNNHSLTHIEITFGVDDESVCDTVYKNDDAKLIAAAPELLKELITALDSHDKGLYYDWDRAEEVINKALGEEK